MPGRTQRQGTKPQRQRGFAAGLRATTGHLQEEVLHHRLRLNRGPHIALGRTHTAVPRGPHQQLDARRTLGRQQVVDIGFTVANADKAGLGTPLVRAAHRLKTGAAISGFPSG